MENYPCVCGGGGGGEGEEQMELPAGFRFHPTDEELITYYLAPKVLNPNFSAVAIGVVDLNKCEPWDLPRMAKMGEKEWYFFCVRDRKYPTGLRTNRATEAGYWKATGKDKEIHRQRSLVGMKKTLVFYKGRAPKGEKSNWVMHEFRLEGRNSPQNLPPTAKNEWVISRVFEKNSSGKKIAFQGLMRPAENSGLPPLMDSSPPATLQLVPCFSSSLTPPPPVMDHFTPATNPYLLPGYYYPPPPPPPLQINQYRNPYGLYGGDSDVLGTILGGGTGEKQGRMMVMKTEGSLSSEISNYEYGMGRGPFDDYQEGPSASGGGPVDIESFLNNNINSSSSNW